jgi:gluconolactonase
VWAAAGKALLCYDPDGTLLGRLRLPEPTANLVFGGPKRNRLFIASATSLYSLLTNVTGARPVWATGR